MKQCKHDIKHVNWSVENTDSLIYGQCLRCGSEWKAKRRHNQISRTTLEEISKEARKSVIHTKGSCLRISKYITEKLIYTYGIPANIVQIRVDGQKHYAVFTLSLDISGIESEYVLIDASRDQFDDTNQSIIIDEKDNPPTK